jgi:hypothetical protein
MYYLYACHGYTEESECIEWNRWKFGIDENLDGHAYKHRPKL